MIRPVPPPASTPATLLRSATIAGRAPHTMRHFIRSPRDVLAAWLARWGSVVPLLGAELIVWLGFGALLPVMPLYFSSHGVSLESLGVVIAAWPAARLVGEPAFGWIADRVPRVPLMILGLILTAIALALPLVLSGPVEFLALRALAGLATSMYDPAARGFLTDATPPARRGEAFGLYGAAQMAGLLLGPAIGGLGAAAFGGVAFVFGFGALATFAAAIAVAAFVRERVAGGSELALGARTAARRRVAPSFDITEFPTEPPLVYRRAADHALGDELEAASDMLEGSAVEPPVAIWNRYVLAAVAVNLGGYFAGGTYEVIWSLYLQSKGAGLDFIGFTFALFAFPVLFLSPLAGRMVDRRGVYGFIVGGAIATIVAAPLYTLITNPVQVIPLLLTEATGFAILNPALFAVVAVGSPRGRSSTTQGIFGAAGTVGTIVASVVTGYLASIDIRYPFLVGGAVMLVCLVLGLLAGGRSLKRLAPSAPVRAFDRSGEASLE
jgi:DHA1 family multidrug resistance protein-like MFS transporter